jgi:arylsulfatase A-like enzyme
MLPTLVKRANQFITDRAKADKPFFLYFALSSPHTPLVPSREWQGKSGLGDYGDFVIETDWAVGQVLAALDQAGLANNTLVIFSSDNGCSPVAGVKELEAKGHFPSGPFRGYKSDIWEGGHRVPFFVRWPGKVNPGSQSSQLISLADFMATCAGLLDAKLPANAGEDSVNLLPAFFGKYQGPLREAVVYNSIEGNFGIQQGSWKLELCPGSGGWGSPKDPMAKKQWLPPVQLYDMEKDIGEKHNVQAEHPEVVKRLTALLEKYVKDGRSTPGPEEKNDSPVDIWKKGQRQSDDDNEN